MRPTDCRECRAEFDSDPLLQMAATAEDRESGPAAARELVDDVLDEFHRSGHAPL